MGFTREEMATYEAKPQTQVSDKTNPFDAEAQPAKPAAEKTPPAAKVQEQEAASSVASDSDPADLEDGTSGATAESSTAITEPDSGADLEEETGEAAAAEEGADTTQQPLKKGSARARIQELADERDGYREFGRQQTEYSKALREENARLRALAEGKPAAAAKPLTPAADTLGPMPQLTDNDINFDPAKLAEKQTVWMEKKIAAGVQQSVKAALDQTTGQQTEEQIKAVFGTRVEEFKQEHKDWLKVVNHPDLPQLSPAASKVMLKSEFGPALLYHLGNDIPLAQRIARMDPEDQVAEIGEIRRELKVKALAAAAANPKPVAGAKLPPKKSVSNAPPPPNRSPAGNRSQERDIQDPGLSMDDFAQRHREQRNTARMQSRQARGLK